MPKEKFTIEYNLNSVSPNVLWGYIGTAHGLANWFADDVQIAGKKYTFVWDKMSQSAEQIGYRNNVFIRFRWDEDECEKCYFEFRILFSELTGGIMLEVTDFAAPEDKEDSIELWDTQVESLKRKLGI